LEEWDVFTDSSWFDFGGELDRDADKCIFKWNFYQYKIGKEVLLIFPVP